MKSHFSAKSALALGISAALATGTNLANAQLEEVIVTAQKREQSVLDVPISIATMSGERFTALFEGGADIRALSTRVPGLYIESSNGRVAPRFYIRGLGNIDFDLAASQPVSVIMDEVVKENVVLKSFPIFDIDRVEVLRGPQGSLFGRNTTAGIVKFESFKPTEEFTGRGKLDVGDYGTMNFEGALGGAITDNLQGRVAVLTQNRDDWIDNDYTGKSDAIGQIEENAIKGFLAWQPTDNVDVLFGAHYRDLDGTSAIFRANVLTTGDDDFNNNYDRETVYFDAGGGNPQEYDNDGYNLKVSWDTGDYTLTSITAYENANGYSRGDIDGGFGASFLPEMGPGFIPFPSDTQDDADVEQFTQELRINNNDAERLFWQAGVFYFDADLDVKTDPGFTAPTTVSHSNEAWAVFGQGDYDLTDEWTLTAGIRWSYDDKKLNAPGDNDADIDDDQISGNLSLAYSPDDSTTYWGKIASGFRGPTIQGRDIAFFGAPSVADSETITSFELGYKVQFLDDRARLNAAAYYYEVDDQQFSAVGGSGNLIQLINADSSNAAGFELDFEFMVNEYLDITFGYAYVDTEIDDNNLEVATCGSGQCTPTDPLRVVDNGDGTTSTFANVDGNPFPNAPESTLSFTASFRYPMGQGEIFAYTDWAMQGDTNIFLYESKEYQTSDQYEGGLRAGYRQSSGKYDWEVAGFVRNITDEENMQGGIDFNNNTAFDNEPRIWGGSVSVEF
ncbi:MAG: TonB-dependent receptor [Halieaceae bacterium]